MISIAECKALYLYLKAVHKTLTYAVLQTIGLIPPTEQPKQAAPQVAAQQPKKEVLPPAAGVDNDLLVKTIEDAMRDTIENKLESIFEDEEIANISLKNKITQASPKVDQKQALMLIKGISMAVKGTTSIKDIVTFLSKVPGKYDQKKVVETIMLEIE